MKRNGDDEMFRPEELDRPRPEDFAAPYFFLSTDRASRVSYASPSFEHVMGFHPLKVLGENCVEFLIREDPVNKGLRDLDQQELSAGRSMHTLRASRDADGNRRILSVLTTGVIDPQTCQVVRRHNIVHDVTRQWAMAVQVRDNLTTLDERISKLSRRDLEISKAAAEGRSNDSLADELGVSVRTIERSRSRLRERLGVQHVSEVVRLMSQRDMLDELWKVHSAHQWRHALNCHL